METEVFGDETPISLLHVNWFNSSLHFCRRGRENLRSLTPDSFVIKKDANDDADVEMSLAIPFFSLLSNAFSDFGSVCHKTQKRKNKIAKGVCS